jgi:hypothetical protein
MKGAVSVGSNSLSRCHDALRKVIAPRLCSCPHHRCAGHIEEAFVVGGLDAYDTRIDRLKGGLQGPLIPLDKNQRVEAFFEEATSFAH